MIVTGRTGRGRAASWTRFSYALYRFASFAASIALFSAATTVEKKSVSPPIGERGGKYNYICEIFCFNMSVVITHMPTMCWIKYPPSLLYDNERRRDVLNMLTIAGDTHSKHVFCLELMYFRASVIMPLRLLPRPFLGALRAQFLESKLRGM